MHKIYFEKRAVIICHPDDQALSDPNAVTFHLGERFDMSALVGMVLRSDSLFRVYIPAEDVDAAYKRICAEFVEVTAGGGLVSNRRGDYLLISRNGLWDLPKGHLEPGEDIRECSLREVQEETGVDELQLRDLICITDHCYLRNGSSRQFPMRPIGVRLRRQGGIDLQLLGIGNNGHIGFNEPDECLIAGTHLTDLTPQTEEDIAKAAWVAKSSLPPFLKNTYPSIQEVFKEAKV